MYTVCNSYKKYSKLNLCKSHYFNYINIESIIISEIENVLSKVNMDKIKEEINKKINCFDYQKEINELNIKYEKLYLDKLNNVINDDMFNKISEHIKSEISSMKEKKNINIDKIINKEINRDLLHQMIKRIEIHEDKTIDLYYTFKSIA